ncbi:MAG: ABC transporter ATP-binding protein [Cyanobacteria bacterium J06639_14]
MKAETKQRLNESLGQELRQLLGYMSRRRQRQLGLLLLLMIVSSSSEVLSLGAVVPFLAALGNAEKLLRDPRLEPMLMLFQIKTTVQLVTSLALIFMTAVIVANGLRILTINMQTYLAAKISSDLSCQLYSNTLIQPYRFHVQHNSSDLINTVTGDTRALTVKILIPMLGLITNSFVVLALVGGLILIDARVAVTATIVLGSTYVGLYHLRRNLLARNSQMLVQSSHQQIKVVQESLGGIRDVLLGGTQEFFESAYEKADRPFRQVTASNQVIAQTPRYIIEALAMIAIGLLALSLGRGDDFSQAIPILGSLALGANRLLPALQQSFSALVKIQGARVSLRRILRGLKRSAAPMQMWIPSVGLLFEDKLRFENVWFRYSDDSDWVLQDLNLSIEARTTVGFVGSTGSGKSTTADLMLGLLKPQRGTIWIDGQPLDGKRLRQWQHGIAHVPQSIFLADATILENIAFGIPKDQINFEQVYKAAQLAKMDEFIRGLPNQYETFVGERGVRLSGGQRQRIGIARALYRQASVIVFDEATSALDNTTEKEVMAAINGLSNQLTIILIAHRLSTVENCDLIFELSRGQLVSQGSYQKLLTGSKSFKLMANRNK